MVVAAAAAAVVANPVAVVPVGSSAYRKKAGTAAGALESSFSQSPSLSLLVRTSTSKPFASISIPTAPLFSCSQGTVSLRVDRARQRSSRSSISASANEDQFGNQDSESTLLNASVQPSLLDTNAKFRTSAEGVTKNAAAQEFEQLLMRKAQELKQEIEGTCIFLIGMMGSGKSTVGRLLAEALEYQFLDSDTVIESYAGGLSVAEIFKKWKEERFRELESQALQELSSAGEVVVATGGGAVVQPRNWVYLRNGITVWLDVPVPALASRVTAVGTGSRPLLGGDCGGYDQALARLSKIYEERGPAYANADVTVSLQNLALSLACEDISELTPTAITVQVLEELIQHARLNKYLRAPVGY